MNYLSETRDSLFYNVTKYARRMRDLDTIAYNLGNTEATCRIECAPRAMVGKLGTQPTSHLTLC